MIGGATKLFGPAAINIVGGLIAKNLFGGAAKAITPEMMQSAVTKGLQDGGAIKGLESAAGNITRTVASKSSKGDNFITNNIVKIIPPSEDQIKMQTASQIKIDWHKLAQFLVGLAGVVLIGLGALWGALEITKGVKRDEIINAGIALAVSAWAISKVGYMVESMAWASKEVDFKGLLKILVGIAAVISVGLASFWVALQMTAGLKTQDILNAGLALAITVGVIGLTGLIMMEMVAVGKLVSKFQKEAITGLDAMVVVLAVIVGVSLIIGGISAVVGPAAMLAGAETLSIIATVFVKVGAILLIAAGVGALIVATEGIGAGLMLAGMSAMAAGVTIVTGTAIVVMQELEKIKEKPEDLKQKAQAFESVMNAIVNLTNSMGEMLKAMNFSIFDNTADIKAKFEGLNKFIKTLLEGDEGGGKGGIIGVIREIVSALKTLTPQSVQAASAIGNVLSAVGNIIGGLSKGAADIQKESSGWGTFSETNAANAAKVMEAAGKYISGPMAEAKTLITAVVDEIKGIPTASISVLKVAGPAIGSILGAVAQMITAIAPNVKEMQKVHTEEALIGSVTDKEFDSESLKKMSDYFSKVIGSVKESFPVLIKAITGDIVGLVKGLKPEEIKALQPIGSVIAAVSSLVSAVGGAIKPEESVKTEKMDGDAVKERVTKITKAAPDLAETFNKIKDSIPMLIDAMVEATKKVPADNGFIKKLETTKTLIEFIAKIPEVAKTLSEIPPVTSAGPPSERLIQPINSIIVFLQTLVNDDIIGELVTSVQEVGNAIKAAEGKNKIQPILESLAKTFGSIKDAVEKLNGIGTIDATGIITNISSAVDVFTKLSSPTGDASIFKLSTSLGTLSTGLSTLNLNAAGQNVGNQLTTFFNGSLFTTLNKISVPSLTPFTESIATFATDFEGVAATLTNSGVEPTLAAVNNIVEKINEMDAALAKTANVKFPARLQALASGMGMGKKMTAVVERGTATINVDLAVYMDASKIEKMILTGESQIRQRLNYIFKNSELHKTTTTQTETSQSLSQSPGWPNPLIAKDGSASSSPEKDD
jgi:hypothetical protein